MNKAAIIIIDIQNDYFFKGKFPLWNAGKVLINIKKLICKANQKQIPVFLIQHISSAPKGMAPFFEKGSEGVKIHPEIISICPNAEVIQKQHADSFYQTRLDRSLEEFGIDELLICGMMTQNCVTHTAISKKAEKYKVSIIEDCCTTTDAMIHKMALNAASSRVPTVMLSEVL